MIAWDCRIGDVRYMRNVLLDRLVPAAMKSPCCRAVSDWLSDRFPPSVGLMPHLGASTSNHNPRASLGVQKYDSLILAKDITIAGPLSAYLIC
jgi:hypothetical protein